jgi:hypothetical protein
LPATASKSLTIVDFLMKMIPRTWLAWWRKRVAAGAGHLGIVRLCPHSMFGATAFTIREFGFGMLTNLGQLLVSV